MLASSMSQSGGGGGGQPGIIALEAPGQPELDASPDRPRGYGPRAAPVGFFEQDGPHGFLLRGEKGPHAGLEDPGLFPGDGFDPVTQKVLMVDPDPGDERQRHRVGWQDVGGVQPPAQTGFQQHEVRRCLAEGEERRRRGQLEECARLVAVGVLHPGQNVEQAVVADGLPAQLDALGKADQMRAGVDVGGLARGFDDGFEKGEGRALAVGPGDVDGRGHAELRSAEVFEQGVEPVERQVDQLGVQGEEAVERRLNPRWFEAHTWSKLGLGSSSCITGRSGSPVGWLPEPVVAGEPGTLRSRLNSITSRSRSSSRLTT